MTIQLERGKSLKCSPRVERLVAMMVVSIAEQKMPRQRLETCTQSVYKVQEQRIVTLIRQYEVASHGEHLVDPQVCVLGLLIWRSRLCL